MQKAETLFLRHSFSFAKCYFLVLFFLVIHWSVRNECQGARRSSQTLELHVHVSLRAFMQYKHVLLLMFYL